MNISDIIKSLLPKKTESESDASANTETSSAQTSSAMALDPAKKVKDAVSSLIANEQALKASFQLAFNQGNLSMMEMLTEVGGYKPSPEMKNDKGVPLKQWLADQSKGADEANRNMFANLERKLESPSMQLSAKALAQVSAIQTDMGQWMGGMSQNASMSLPFVPQRSAGLAMAA